MAKVSNYKKYNKVVLGSFFILLFIICLMNYFINPFNIFKQHIFKTSLLKPEAKIQERITKPVALKFNHDKIDTIFMGSSRTDLGISTDYYKKLTSKTAENIAMGGLKSDEIIDSINIALKTHPEIKNIYIELNYSHFLSDENIKDNRAEITDNPKITTEDLGVSFLSFKATTNSIWTIVKNCLGIKEHMYYSTGEKYIFENENILSEFVGTWLEYNTIYKKQKYDKKKTQKIISYINYLEKQGKNVYLYIYPSHASEFYLIYKNGQQNDYENWKKEFAKIMPVYDFQYPNEITSSKINPKMDTYFDGSHSTYIVGNKILDDMLNCKDEKSCKFARYMTKNNADTINKKNYDDMKNWIKNNQDTIKIIEKCEVKD